MAAVVSGAMPVNPAGTGPAVNAAAPAGGGGAGRIVAKVGGSRNAAVLGAGATVVLVGLLALRKNASSADSSDTTDGTFDSSESDAWALWQQEYEDLQQQLIAQQAGQTTATGPGGSPPAALPPVKIGNAPPISAPRPHPVVTPVPKAPVKTTTPVTHKTVTVKAGDTLSAIASRYGISMATLKKLNPTYWTNPKYKSGNLIWSGDKVKVS
jgi:LysM repeat protein